jgi:hypothetical protein
MLIRCYSMAADSEGPETYRQVAILQAQPQRIPTGIGVDTQI